MSAEEKLVTHIINTLQEHKGINITKIDLRKIENCFCRFFVICHGNSNTHVSSMADFVYDGVNKDLQEKPIHMEGADLAQWIVMDYGNVMVHVFQKEVRDYYQLEDFWADAEITEIKEN